MVFSNNFEGHKHLFIYDIKSERIIDLGEGHYEQWFSDGRIIFYSLTDDGYMITNSAIYIINENGTGKQKIIDIEDHIEKDVTISSNGKSISYRDNKSGKIFIGELKLLK